MTNLVQTAKSFALRAHGQQCRPNATREPFAIHLAEVASYVADEKMDHLAIAAAWLHDVIEDTPTVVAEIADTFGDEVARIVDLLTDPADWSCKALAERKPLQAARIKEQDARVKVIKLADQISNIRSVILDPPVDWSQSKSRDYINGALFVGRACVGASLRLDHLLESYAAAGQQGARADALSRATQL